MAVSPIEEPLLLTDRVFAAIHEAIMRGELPAGARLRVRDLAAQVGTSVMPVREAIRRLEEAGLAERVPHKGAVVRSLTRAELVHVYDVRITLETDAARLGGDLLDAAGATAMQRCYDEVWRAVQEGRAIDALGHDERMTEILYAATGNPVLLDVIRGLWQRCRAYKILGARRAQEADDVSLWSFQPRILAAARDHDGETAARLTRESLLSARARVEATFEDAT